mmetsp:Transcript_100311/g.284165  ORF Transcript_100311/g.284165 Transcript_100311/m.284165 type:complete len:318 (+) Transcript_100311:62-1015(+)
MSTKRLLSLWVCCLLCLHRALALSFVRPSFDAGPNGTLRLNATRLAWLHIPKTGMSFANTILTWGCPRFPGYLWIGKNCGKVIPCDGPVKWKGCGTEQRCGMWAGMKRHFGDKCVKDFNWGFEQGHKPIGGSPKMRLSDHKGSFLAMFRQPEQRLISGFNHRKHGYRNKKASIGEYARHMSGCATRMIIGRQCGEGNISHEDVSEAIQVVEKEFAFVGLTEEWELTVCLFHRMFGGSCNQREFLNVRPGTNYTEQGYNTSVLGGYRDEFDGRLHEAAVKIFWSNVHEFGVNRETCAKSCPVANFFEPDFTRFAFDQD